MRCHPKSSYPGKVKPQGRELCKRGHTRREKCNRQKNQKATELFKDPPIPRPGSAWTLAPRLLGHSRDLCGKMWQSSPVLTKQICLVLGAGASQPYGFPTGGELMKFVRDTQSDDWWPLAKLVSGYGKLAHDEFVERLTFSGVSSIDQFVGQNPTSDKYAKTLICRYISRMEMSSNVLYRPNGGDWVTYLLRECIVGGVRRLADLKPKWPHVVTFNYDRSFEELVSKRLIYAFEGAMPSQIFELLRQWKIIHVHGSLGKHPALTTDGSGRLFEPIADAAALDSASSQIHLVHDVDADSPEFTQARGLIDDSELVFFLGFGFNTQNLEKLFPTSSSPPKSALFSTQRSDVTSAIKKAHARGIVLSGPNHSDCLGLLDEHAYTYSQ